MQKPWTSFIIANVFTRGCCEHKQERKMPIDFFARPKKSYFLGKKYVFFANKERRKLLKVASEVFLNYLNCFFENKINLKKFL